MRQLTAWAAACVVEPAGRPRATNTAPRPTSRERRGPVTREGLTHPRVAPNIRNPHGRSLSRHRPPHGPCCRSLRIDRRALAEAGSRGPSRSAWRAGARQWRTPRASVEVGPTNTAPHSDLQRRRRPLVDPVAHRLLVQLQDRGDLRHGHEVVGLRHERTLSAQAAMPVYARADAFQTGTNNDNEPAGAGSSRWVCRQ